MKSSIKVVLTLGLLLLGAVLLRIQPAPVQAAPVSVPSFPAVPTGGVVEVFTTDGKSVDGLLKGINQDWVVVDTHRTDVWVPRSTVRMLRINKDR
jgi:hypothetical protein